MAATVGPWRVRRIPGQLFELHNDQGEIVLRQRGGMLPTEDDGRQLARAPFLRDLVLAVRAFIAAEPEDLTDLKCHAGICLPHLCGRCAKVLQAREILKRLERG